MTDVERYQRAGDYVFGLMDSAERARAEHDLERDADFRLAVSALTARIRAADREIAARQLRQSGWQTIAADLAALPQMQRTGATHARLEPVDDPVEAQARRRLPMPFVVAIAFCLGVAVGFGAGALFSPEGTSAIQDPPPPAVRPEPVP